MGALAFLRRIPWEAWALVGVLLTLWAFGHWRYSAGVDDEHERQEVAQAKALREFAQARDKVEAAQRQTLAQVRAQLEREKANAVSERDSVIAELRGGAVRVRERFRCPGNVVRLPEAPRASGRSDATEGRGLLNEDAEFLIRFASEADETAKQLKACQNVIRTYQGE